MLAYGRLVSGYVDNKPMEEAEQNMGLYDGEFDSELEPETSDLVRSNSSSGHQRRRPWQHEQTFVNHLMDTIQTFKEQLQPESLYKDPGAKKSVLHMGTTAVLEKVKPMKMPPLEKIRIMGEDWAAQPENQEDDAVIAVQLGIGLSSQLKGLCKDVLGGIEEALIGKKDQRTKERVKEGLCGDFYDAIAQVEFKLDA